jgi:uncharacterized membrane protein
MAPGAGRVRAFDWLRGIAVIVMVQTHALSLLEPGLRKGLLFARLQVIDGLVAPSFILAAGFSLALVQVRGARSGGRGRRALKSVRRIGEVLAVSAFMTWIWFPIFREPKWLLRIDILSCIGLSLLAALPLFAAFAQRPRLLAAVSLGLALAVFLSTPAANRIRSLPLAHLTGTTSGSVFPLFPWSGYVFLGGALGALCALASARAIAGAIGLLWAVGLALWSAASRLHAADPLGGFYICVNHAERWIIVLALAFVLAASENGLRGRWQQSAPIRFVEVFGTSSLAAYFFHEAMLYWPLVFGFSFHAKWGDRLGWAGYWSLTALLIALTFALSWVAGSIYDAGPRLRSALRARSGRGDRGAGATLG